MRGMAKSDPDSGNARTPPKRRILLEGPVENLNNLAVRFCHVVNRVHWREMHCVFSSCQLQVCCLALRRLMELTAASWSQGLQAWCPEGCPWPRASTFPCTRRPTPKRLNWLLSVQNSS